MKSFEFFTYKKPHFGLVLRLFGYGFYIQESKNYQPLFSERQGYRKAYYFLGLRLEILKPQAKKKWPGLFRN